jgi:hypothetical protein
LPGFNRGDGHRSCRRGSSVSWPNGSFNRDNRGKQRRAEARHRGQPALDRVSTQTTVPKPSNLDRLWRSRASVSTETTDRKQSLGAMLLRYWFQQGRPQRSCRRLRPGSSYSGFNRDGPRHIDSPGGSVDGFLFQQRRRSQSGRREAARLDIVDDLMFQQRRRSQSRRRPRPRCTGRSRPGFNRDDRSRRKPHRAHLA